MATFNVKVVVHYEYEVEADDESQADKLGWNYEDYGHCAEVYSIDSEEVESEEDDEEEEEGE
jgi:hypothetical protein